jgi:phosphoribosylglycinamide formyltransferase-1
MRFATFASGGGSNFGALLDAARAGTLGATPCLLVADRAGTGAEARAREAGVPVAVLPPPDVADADAWADALLDALDQTRAGLVVLAGFLKKIPPPVVRAYADRMLNVHPSLLPLFGGHGLYGQRVHRAVLDAGAKQSGATVHLVDADYDTGPIVAQQPVPVLPGDTPQTLAARVLAVEHRLLPAVVSLFAQDRVRVEGRHVAIEGVSDPRRLLG